MLKLKKLNSKEWLVVAVGSLMIFGIGYLIGYAQGLDVCITAAKKLLDIQLDPAGWSEVIRRYPEIIQYIK